MKKPIKPKKTTLKEYTIPLNLDDNPFSELDSLFYQVKKDIPNLDFDVFKSECVCDYTYCYVDGGADGFRFVYRAEVPNTRYKTEYEKYKRKLEQYNEEQEANEQQLTEKAKKLLVSKGYKVV